MKLSIFQSPARRARAGWAASVVAVACACGASHMAWHHLQARLEGQAAAAHALQAANEKLLSRLDAQEQRLVEAQRKSVDWWLTTAGIFMGALGFLIAVAGILLPWWNYQRLKKAEQDFAEMRRIANDEQTELRRIRQDAEQALSKLQTHEQEAARRLQAEKQASKFKSGESQSNAEQIDSAVQTLKQAPALTSQLLAAAITASQVENPTKKQAERAYELWKLLTLLDAADHTAHLNAGYWAQQMYGYEQADAASRQHWLAALQQHYGALPPSYEHAQAAFSNWGQALSEEASAVAKNDLPAAQKLWTQAYEKFKQAWGDSPKLNSTVAFNWGLSLLNQAQAISTAVSPNLEASRALWAQAHQKIAYALHIDPGNHKAVDSSAAAYLHESQALRKAGQMQEADELLNHALALILQHLKQYPKAAAQLAYNLACIYGLQGNAKEAIAQLELARQNNLLPPGWREDKDFDPIRHSQEYRDWVAQHSPSSPHKEDQ